MKNLFQKLQSFFLPPAGAPTWVRVLPYVVLGLMTLVLLTAGAYGWEYTNSPEFCGTSCHTMPPEYTAYLTSPHARIACVDCHIGKGFITTRVTRKAGDLKHVFATAFHTYEFPIRAGDLRPARETCELCHFPDKFSDDSLREIKRYTSDMDNTPLSIYLTLKTGGGSQRQGLGRGIHWHIQNKIDYLPIDAEEQDIPYIRVTNSDGTVNEYIDLQAEIDPAAIDPAQLKEMDCITCHNRITHLVLSPEDTIDQLLARGQISSAIPEIHRKALEVYSRVYDTTEKGLIGIAGLEDYYSTYHSDFYAANSQLVKDAITALQTAYSASVYPEQNSDWTSHPNNVGHKDSPGCFRCHDGKHLDANQQAIRLECNLCHSIPVVAGPYDFKTEIEISRGPEPQSHLSANWIGLHNQAIDQTCANCHTTADPGGVSNTSFCSNSACHGSVWKYAGFDAPALRQVLVSQLPPTPTPAPLPSGGPLTYQDTIGPLLQARCGACHSVNGIQGLDVTTFASLMQGGQNGPVVLPGDVENSLLVQKQSGDLPHFGQLTPEELQTVIQWIQAGAPEK
ncbi:MAG: NapC/NirT family cytochrome c [Chloroflexota bacterium]